MIKKNSKMNNVAYRIVFLMLFLLNSLIGISQDTIEVKNRSELDRLIQYTFLENTGGLNPTLRKKINQEFKKHDFSKKEYHCQYIFDFIIELDSLGNIKNCKQIGSHNDSVLNEFSEAVISTIRKSNYHVANWVYLEDTSFCIETVQFSFEMSCEPRELIFEISENEKSKKRYVLCTRNDGEMNCFSGFSELVIEERNKKKR